MQGSKITLSMRCSGGPASIKTTGRCWRTVTRQALQRRVPQRKSQHEWCDGYIARVWSEQHPIPADPLQRRPRMVSFCLLCGRSEEHLLHLLSHLVPSERISRDQAHLGGCDRRLAQSGLQMVSKSTNKELNCQIKSCIEL